MPARKAAVAAMQALEHIGMPEARLNIAQAILYICECPKSDSVTRAAEAAFFDAEHCRIQVHIHPQSPDIARGVSHREEEDTGAAMEEELDALDLDRDVELYSQTTKSLSGFRRIVEAIRERKRSGAFRYYDTICRQVANRMGHLREFARTHEVIVFVCGAKSSNGKALYEACREVNPRSYLSVNQDAIDPAWVEGARTIGICGATSTPSWLMNKVKDKIEEICTR